jgi:hypothetical protein
MEETATRAPAFTRGDRVRYIGDNDFKGLEGRVRGIDPYLPGGMVDVDLELWGCTSKARARLIRKIVAPENLDRTGWAEAATA